MLAKGSRHSATTATATATATVTAAATATASQQRVAQQAFQLTAGSNLCISLSAADKRNAMRCDAMRCSLKVLFFPFPSLSLALSLSLCSASTQVQVEFPFFWAFTAHGVLIN